MAPRQERGRRSTAEMSSYRVKQELKGYATLLEVGGHRRRERKGVRTYCARARLSALLPLVAALGQRLFGLTMSLDGRLEDVEESLRAAANCCCNRAFSLPKRSTSACSRTFSSYNVVLRSITDTSFPLSFATRWTRRSCSQADSGFRSFIRRGNAHPWTLDPDQSPAQKIQEFWYIRGSLGKPNPLLQDDACRPAAMGFQRA